MPYFEQNKELMSINGHLYFRIKASRMAAEDLNTYEKLIYLLSD